MTNLAPLIAKLQAWTMETGDFHSDRQLADEVLIADGWKCEPDESFEGGVRWFWGTNPQISASESSRPHVINDLNTAIGVVPFGCNWQIEMRNNRAEAQVWAQGKIPHGCLGRSERPSVAILIAALRYKQAHP